MLEYTEFRKWYYGTSIDVLQKNKINIGVFNIHGIQTLLNNPLIKVIPIRIVVPDKIRLLRSLSRENNPDCQEICRRFLTDTEDFKTIPFEYDSYDNTNEINEETLDFFSSHLETLLTKNK